MILYALAAAGIASRGVLLAGFGAAAAKLVGGWLAEPEPAAEVPVRRVDPVPPLRERPARRVQRLAAELAFYIDRDNREPVTDDVGNLGPLLVGNV